jgi:hypothetical protein
MQEYEILEVLSVDNNKQAGETANINSDPV